MKYAYVVVLFWAGSLAIPASAQGLEKTWIFFTDKFTVTGKTTQVEPGYISPRAKERRQRRGTKHSPIHDAPISPMYLDALAAKGIEVIHHSRWLNAVSAYLSEDQRDAVDQLSFVRRLQPVRGLAKHVSKPAPVPPVVARRTSRRLDCGNSCTQLGVANAITPLDNGINGQGVVIGFVDTRFDYNGVQLGHPATKHLADSNRVRYKNFTADDPGVGSQLDWSLHGLNTTSVAIGYETGELIGPCYGADSVYVAHTEWAPQERNVEEDNFVAGVEWMEAGGVDVINSSLGYTTFDPGQNDYTTSDMDGDTGITTIAFDLAAEKGVVPVSSAGNSGGSTSWPIIGTPADGDSVIAVGGVRSDRSRSSFSSRGPSADGRIKPDVAAQASDVWIAYSSGGYGYGDGTSFSSPMVAGVVCQLLQVNPDLNPHEVKELLAGTASQATNPDTLLGWGIINAESAIDSARATSNAGAAPVPPTFVVHAPFPNPFADEAQFELELPDHMDEVRITVYNILGQLVLTPFAGPLGAGTHPIRINARGLPAGLYTYVVSADGRTQTGQLVHVR